ncbi:hypothetical protein BD779DRAFT_1667039 [Infundibulicybe gibba]|nr:hypothetical protein BD779DRAFT_1667039 [Infundibulicybe gibba]
MVDTVSIQHPPAVKVGGRRLSTTTRPKPAHTPEVATAEPVSPAEEILDYPRPAPPGGEEQVHPHVHAEEEIPLKKERKHHDNESKLKELAHSKGEMTRPTREHAQNGKGFGAGGRIAQPAGKGLGV